MNHKTAAQASITLVGVVALYVAPWLLGLVPHSLPTLELVHLPTVQREAVVWFPPPPPVEAEAVPEELALAVEEPAEPAPIEPIEPIDSPPPTEAAASEPTVTPAATDTPPRQRPQRVRRPRPRPTQVAATTPVPKSPPKPPVALTPKQERQRERITKRRERLAAQPQCRDHLDLILRVEAEDDRESYLVGEELVSCYRAHPQQFMDMGGMEWAEEKGKKIGLRVYVSSRQRGEVARTVGFQKGDILHSLNGISLRSTATVTLALTQLTRNKAKLKYVRNGEKRVFEVRVVDLEELEEAREALEEAQEALAAAQDADEPQVAHTEAKRRKR